MNNEHQQQEEGMIGGVAIVLGTLIALGIFAVLLGSTSLEVTSIAMFDQNGPTQNIMQQNR